MKRKNALDSSKLLQISSKNSVIDVYADSFPIEQVKFRIADYNTPQTSIDIYMDFSEFLKIAFDVKNGEIFRALDGGKQIIIARGGTPANRARRQDGKAEARQMSLGMSNGKIYWNASLGAGNASQTGLIMPAGAPEKKVSAMMTVADFKRLIIYTEAAINAYLPTIVSSLVDAAQKTREEFMKNNQYQAPQSSPTFSRESSYSPDYTNDIPSVLI